MDTERQIMEINVCDLTEADGEYSMTLTAFVQWLHAKVMSSVPSEFIDAVRVNSHTEYGQCDSYNIVTIDYERPETDQEMAARIVSERQDVVNREYRELQELHRLQAKFGLHNTHG